MKYLPFRRPGLLILAGAALFTGVPATSEEPYFQKTTLFESEQGGYERYRIPGIVITDRGTVIVSCDARRSAALADWSDIDLFIRRSPDLGRTWEAPVKLAHRDVHLNLKLEVNPAAADLKLSSPAGLPFNNQTLLVNRRNGEILFVYCFNYSRTFIRRSQDEGITWSEPREIVTALNELRQLYPFRVIGTGPNHGIQLRDGRLLIPVWLSTGRGSGGHRPSVVSSIYSDDDGETWHGGQIAAQETDPLVNPSETVAVELSGGGVLFSMRSESLQHRRGIAYSPDGATNWTRPEFSSDLAEPVCMAGIERLSYPVSGERSRIVYSHCDNGTEADPRSRSRFFVRRNLTVRLSYDEGRSWPDGRVIEPGYAGYSDITVAPDGTMFCFFETGVAGGTASANNTGSLVLAHFNLEWLTSGRDSFSAKPTVFKPIPPTKPFAETRHHAGEKERQVYDGREM